MQPADVGDLAGLLHHIAEHLALAEVTGLDARRFGGHAVRQEVLVGPGDAVPGGDLEPLGDELHAFYADFMPSTAGGRRLFYFFARSACACLACSRCVAIAGRTLTI